MKNTLGILTIALGITGVASANTLTLATQTIPASAATFSDVLQFITFNSSLGTLTNVEIDSTANFTANLQIQNTSGSVDHYSGATATGSVDVLGPGSTDITLTGTTVTEKDTAMAANSTDTWSSLTASSTPSPNVFNPTDLADYIGNGVTSVGMTFRANNFSAGGFGSGGLLYSASGTAGGTVDIIYTYTPNSSPATPEPATWATMGGALLVLVAVRKRFFARRAN